MTDCDDTGTISAAHLYQLIARTIERNDRLLHQLTARANTMSTESQALLAGIGELESSNASLIGLAQALKAKADEGAASIAALAAEQAAHAATNADVVAAAERVAAVKAADDAAVVENTPT